MTPAEVRAETACILQRHPDGISAQGVATERGVTTAAALRGLRTLEKRGQARCWPERPNGLKPRLLWEAREQSEKA